VLKEEALTLMRRGFQAKLPIRGAFLSFRGLKAPRLLCFENLKFSLIRRRFTEEAAAKAAQNYLDPMSLVAENGGATSTRVANVEDSRPMPVESPEGSRRTSSVVTKGVERAEFPLPEGIVRFEFPSGISADSYEEIEAWFSLVLRRLKRAITSLE